MIARLRGRHRITVTVLAAVVPVVLVLALTSRQTIPTMGQLPPALEAGSGATATDTVVVAGVAFALVSTEASVVRTEPLQPGDPRIGPDVLVYWSAAAVGAPAELDGATLLGRLAGNNAVRFSLPRADGYLVLFGGARQSVLGATALPGAGN